MYAYQAKAKHDIILNPLLLDLKTLSDGILKLKKSNYSVINSREFTNQNIPTF